MSARRWALLAAFAASLWTLAHLPPRLFDRAKETNLYMYLDPGEALLHAVEPGSGTVSFNMPMASLGAAWAFDHSNSGRLWRFGSAAAACLILWALSASVGAGWSGAGALLLLALCRPEGWYGKTGWPLSAYTLLALLAAGWCVLRAKRSSAGASAALGAAVGVSVLFRSPLALFPFLFAAVEVGSAPPKDRRRRLRHAGLVALFAFLPLAPWVLMNAAVHGRLIFLEDGRADPEFVTGALGLVKGIEGDIEALVDDPEEKRDIVSGGSMSWAVRKVLSEPAPFIRGFLERLLYVFRLQPVLILLALSAAWRFRRRREVRALALLAGYYGLVHCIISFEDKYFEPLWPMLAALAGAWALELKGPNDAWTQRRAAGLLKGFLAAAALAAFVSTGFTLRYAWAASRGRVQGPGALQAALERSPGDAWLLMRAAREELLAAEPRKAAASAAKAAAAAPEDVRIAFESAWASAFAGEPGDFFKFRLPQGYDSANEELDIHLRRAAGLAVWGRDGEARAALSQAEAVWGEAFELVYHPDREPERSALARFKSERLGLRRRMTETLLWPWTSEEAGRVAELFLTVEPKSPALWLALAGAQHRRGKSQEALLSVKRALSADAFDDEKRAAAVLAVRLGDANLALDALENLEGGDFADAELRLAAAELAVAKVDKKTAWRGFEAAARYEAEDFAGMVDLYRRLIPGTGR